MGKIRSLATGAIFLLFLAGAVGSSFLSFQRKVATFSSVGVESAVGRGEVRVLAVDPRAETDLRTGDRKIRVGTGFGNARLSAATSCGSC